MLASLFAASAAGWFAITGLPFARYPMCLFQMIMVGDWYVEIRFTVSTMKYTSFISTRVLSMMISEVVLARLGFVKRDLGLCASRQV
ncbi:MAG: hypothetical protein J3Q66DRAFT_326864 [Benniella sp.]|nr:MAG: hypothetical protein J3Q66DRAFT_326864 [Benniella sp.]